MLPQNSDAHWVTSPFMGWLTKGMRTLRNYLDDEKFGRCEHYSGPTSDFKEKEGYKPNVKLDYIDDDGHVLNAKEAFRYLSHEFHGKGPGRNKVEKQMKKTEQEGLMKQMSSTDTHLERLASFSRSRKKYSLHSWSLVAGNHLKNQTADSS